MSFNNHLNKVYPLFDRLYKELSPGFCLIDIFSDYFHFHIVNHKDIKAKSAYQRKLDEIFNNSTSNSNTILVISDTFYGTLWTLTIFILFYFIFSDFI